MPIIKCAKCAFCVDLEPQVLDALDKPKIGQCRCHAPRSVFLLPDGRSMTLWPSVKIFYDGCGEGEVGISTLIPGNGHK